MSSYIRMIFLVISEYIHLPKFKGWKGVGGEGGQDD